MTSLRTCLAEKCGLFLPIRHVISTVSVKVTCDDSPACLVRQCSVLKLSDSALFPITMKLGWLSLCSVCCSCNFRQWLIRCLATSLSSQKHNSVSSFALNKIFKPLVIVDNTKHLFQIWFVLSWLKTNWLVSIIGPPWSLSIAQINGLFVARAARYLNWLFVWTAIK